MQFNWKTGGVAWQYRGMFPFRCAPVLLVAVLFAAPSFAAPGDALVSAAKRQIGVTVQYDPRYEKLSYPGGDVPIERGVCTDVVVRAYRVLGIDLQKLVHEDMSAAWRAYPNPWKLKGTDKNIDHRRVPNLATFFGRHGSTLPASSKGSDYKPGDIVTWMVPPRLPHIGIVAGEKSATGVPLVIHNIGSGTRMEDVLFGFPITGHYRFDPPAAAR